MNWIEASRRGRLPSLLCAAFLLLAALAVVRSAWSYFAGGASLTVFWRGGSYQVELESISGKPYIELARLLQPLGETRVAVNASKMRIEFGSERAEFENGKGEARIGKFNVRLGEPFVMQNGRGLLALRLVPDLIPYFLNEPADYHAVSQRLFIGSSGRHFTAELKKQPPQLVFSFTGAVNPQVHTESGKLTLNFLRDGVSASAQSWKFADSIITSASYDETASGPEITVTGSQPLMAIFSDGGRVVTIAPAPGATSQTAAPPQPSAAPAIAATQAPTPPVAPSTAPTSTAQASVPPEPAPAAPTEGAPMPAIPRVRSLVIIDAAHGGDERGAALSATLAEKDVCLAMARRLRTELQNRGVPVFLLRDGDITMPLDQRAMAVNSTHPAMYIAIHAGTLGRGLRIYTSMLSPTAAGAGVFVPWEVAQAGYLQQSRSVAGAIVQGLGKEPTDFPVAMMPAPVRPLNNITAPALAIELSPKDRNADSVSDTSYQQKVATALAAAIASARPGGQGQ
jgi:N-acetylmuramoyl-L-alanine amidase